MNNFTKYSNTAVWEVIKMVLDKCYDKNGKEIPRGTQLEKCKELSDFLTKIVQNLKTKTNKTT